MNEKVWIAPGRLHRRRADLSKNQLAVLIALFNFYDQTGVCPSYRELATLVGLESSAAVLAKIVVLEQQGLVTRTQLRRSRNVIVTDKGKCVVRRNQGEQPRLANEAQGMR